jgi:hypothetical protein
MRKQKRIVDFVEIASEAPPQTDENRMESISPQRFTLLDKINSSSAPFFIRQRI